MHSWCRHKLPCLLSFAWNLPMTIMRRSAQDIFKTFLSNCEISACCNWRFIQHGYLSTHWLLVAKFNRRCYLHVMSENVLSLKIEWIFTLFVTEVTPWGVTSMITSFGVNIEWTGRDSTRFSEIHSTGIRIEWNLLFNEWHFFTPWMEWIIHSIS